MECHSGTSAIEQRAKTTYGALCHVNDIHIRLDYNPLEHKGALLRVSPEEVGAVVLAMARDIHNQKADTVLQGWKRTVLSATGTFKILPSATERY